MRRAYPQVVKVELETRLALDECRDRLHHVVRPAWRLLEATFGSQPRLYGSIHGNAFEMTIAPPTRISPTGRLSRSPWLSGRMQPAAEGTQIAGHFSNWFDLHPLRSLALVFVIASSFLLIGSFGAELLFGSTPSLGQLPAVVGASVLGTWLTWAGRNWFPPSDVDEGTLVAFFAAALDARDVPMDTELARAAPADAIINRQ
jgi:hypothetical protein